MLETILTTHQLPIWAEEFSRSVVAAYRPDCVILFGSVAQGAQTQDSDIDILVIGGDLPADHRARFRLLMRLRPLLAPIQVHSFTRGEWDQMMATKRVTALEALRDGRALHGQRLFARWRRQFRRWEGLGLRRTECSWVVPPALLPNENGVAVRNSTGE
jgi:predicted nucleotidyltransferase